MIGAMIEPASPQSDVLHMSVKRYTRSWSNPDDE